MGRLEEVGDPSVDIGLAVLNVVLDAILDVGVLDTEVVVVELAPLSVILK